jgi:hypothetical protein
MEMSESTPQIIGEIRQDELELGPVDQLLRQLTALYSSIERSPRNQR